MRPSEPVLLVEDTRSLSTLYDTYLTRAGYRVSCAYTAGEALDAYEEKSQRIVLLDLMLPDRDGIEVLREIHGNNPDAKVLVITANGSINRAVEAMREGAFDFLVKPFDERRLLGAVENAIASLAPDFQEPEAVVTDREDGSEFEGFIGSSPAMHKIYDMVGNIARSTATVFITGESGTGKEVCAEAIHNLSIRRKGPFVPINCGAIPRDLLESELFGHLRGAFTGALADKRGAAAVADGGTLFLDEICEIDLALQTKLLRFLQTSMIQPVGSTQPHKVDVRIVCATNRDPAEEVRGGRFREDLYYRLHVVPIHLPPLRDRGDDVIEIAEVLLARFATEESRTFQRLSAETRQRFLEYSWPGNVRQLQNVLRNMVVLHEGTELTPEMLPAEMTMPPMAPTPVGATMAPQPISPPAAPTPPLEAPGERAIKLLVGTTLAEMERLFIEATIEECDGSIPKAARILAVSPSTIYRKRDAWGAK